MSDSNLDPTVPDPNVPTRHPAIIIVCSATSATARADRVIYVDGNGNRTELVGVVTGYSIEGRVDDFRRARVDFLGVEFEREEDSNA